MDLKLKFELKFGLQMNGYFTIISDDLDERRKFIEEIKVEFPEIEIMSEYSLKHPELIIEEKLQNHSVMLVNLEEKLKKCKDIDLSEVNIN